MDRITFIQLFILGLLILFGITVLFTPKVASESKEIIYENSK